MKKRQICLFAALLCIMGLTSAVCSADPQAASFVIDDPDRSIAAVQFSPDGKIIASAGDDAIIRLWSSETGVPLAAFEGHSQRITRIAFSPDGLVLASASLDHSVRLWDLTSGGKSSRDLAGHGANVFDVAFSPDGAKLSSSSMDKSVRIWDVRTGEMLKTLLGHEHFVYQSTFTPDGKKLVSASLDGTLKIWDVATGNNLQTLRGHTAKVFSVAISPDGTRIASSSEDKTIRIWDTATGLPLSRLIEMNAPVRAVVFSPDGKLIAFGIEEANVRIVDFKTGQIVQDLVNISRVGGYALAFSPDSTILAAGSQYKVQAWNVTPDGIQRSLKEGRRQQELRWAALNALKCDEVASIDRALSEGYGYQKCEFEKAFRAKTPKELYLAGSQAGSMTRTKALYEELISRYPNDPYSDQARKNMSGLFWTHVKSEKRILQDEAAEPATSVGDDLSRP
ncbi:MAG: WD40 repeat domain-containing protein [Hyphomicrobium sp.]